MEANQPILLYYLNNFFNQYPLLIYIVGGIIAIFTVYSIYHQLWGLFALIPGLPAALIIVSYLLPPGTPPSYQWPFLIFVAIFDIAIAYRYYK